MRSVMSLCEPLSSHLRAERSPLSLSFLAATQGGHDLVPGKAATPVALSHAVTNAAVGAGLPPASMYAFRRDGGNDVSSSLNIQLTGIPLNVAAIVCYKGRRHYGPIYDGPPKPGRWGQ